LLSFDRRAKSRDLVHVGPVDLSSLGSIEAKRD
jgi:hypothetical protein